ncbi:MAG: lysophospholipid acyltransferase family protein [Acidiferrobacteraceae bacterium]
MNKASRPAGTLGAPRHWPGWFVAAFLFLLGRLPAPVLALLGDGLGTLLYVLAGARRRVALRNLSACFPKMAPSRHRRLARRHFRALGRSLLDPGLFWWASVARLRRLVRISGRAHYDAALATGRPIILLVPHFVAIQAGILLSVERPMAFIYRPLDNDVLGMIYARQLGRFKGQGVARRHGLRGALRALKERQPLYYLPDQDFGRTHAVFAPFFGVPAATTTALSWLARASGALVVPCLTRQHALGGYEIILQPALSDYPSGDDLADARRMNAVIEQAVASMPEQYFWVHKRFKTRPLPGDADFYSVS